MNDSDSIEQGPKLTFYLLPIGLLILFGLFLMAHSSYSRGRDEFPLAVVIIFGAIYQYLTVKFTRYSLIGNALVIQTGIIARDKQVIPVEKITDVTVRYNILQRLFGCGDIYVDTAGQFKNTFIRNIDNPEVFAEMLLKRLKKS